MTNAAAPEPQPGVPPERPRLAREFGELLVDPFAPEIHDVVIVGSGYGGSVAAQALAGLVKPDGTQVTVCVLERGREYLPGEFPQRFEDLPGHLRRSSEDTGLITGNPEGLFDVRMGPDVAALVANGVGGGSLINAGVLLQPLPDDFEPGSPARGLVDALREGGWYAQAMQALGGGAGDNTIERHPQAGLIKKTEALGVLGGRATMTRPPLSVSMRCGPNDADVQLAACTLCGDCMTGCNVGAKDSLDTNLLDRAVRGNVKVYTGASVVTLERDDKQDLWVLRVVHTDPSLSRRENGPAKIRARHVILAAGTLGSTEILLRSRSQALVFSPRLGEGFSCNGDNLSAVYDMGLPTNGCADEDTPRDGRLVGPTITGSVQLYTEEGKPGQRGFQLQEFAVPGPMKRIFDELVTTAKALNDLPDCDPQWHGGEALEALDPLAVDDPAMGRTLLVGTIGHDAAEGVLYMPRPLSPRRQPAQQGTLGIRWPGARNGMQLEQAHDRVAAAVQALRAGGADQAKLVANPIWRLLPEQLESLVAQPRGPVLTVHPLGGCRIGRRGVERGDAGVVDGIGRVRNFMPSSPGLFDTLVVLDGSIIPGSLGVNPALTITATAMRAMARLRKLWGYVEAPVLPSAQPVIWKRRRAPQADVPRPGNLPEPPAGRGSTEIQIVERLGGRVSLDIGGIPRECWVELTLAYRPLPIGHLMGPLRRHMNVDPGDEASRIRIFDAAEWEARHLKLESDATRRHWALFEGRLCGKLTVLAREPSRAWRRSLRSSWAWLLNRGLREIDERRKNPKPAKDGKDEGGVSYGLSLLRMGTRAGEVRRLDYELGIAEVLAVRGDMQGLRLQAGDVIRGAKRLTYGRRANPWRQLTRLSLDEMPMLARGRSAVLVLDGSFLAGQGFPLLRIAKQRNSAVALADLASFGLYMTRLLASIHLWTFRKPDAQPRRKPDRLPGPLVGIAEPEIMELAVDRYPNFDKPVTIRLTRYRQRARPDAAGAPAAGQPLVMIHGYSASGNTFTHASLPTSAAAYFCERGRDVWVVDLRTSSALPSCTYPWSMEQVGLIDIPAALLHIRSVTNQPVDVLAHCIGCVMLSMALLTDAQDVYDNTIQLGSETWLTRHHLGQLKAFNTRIDDRHPVIRKLVLSQKGPVLRYTDENILRAFLLQSLRRWLMRDDYQFQPGDDPGVMEELMDRLLASIPYEDADYDIENPLRCDARVPWVATRHRMDALYGRAFDATNMAPATLDAINDIFGPINLETVSQTIHFARFNAITNQAGRGEFVTRDRLSERWGGIDTYAIHGANNGLVDVLTQTLLRQHFQLAGVRFAEPQGKVRDDVYGKLGHQDVLMGIHSHAVFEDLQRFLTQPVEKPARQDLPRFVAALPWSGPRLVVPPYPGGCVTLACLSNPTQGKGWLCLVPAVRQTGPGGEREFRLIGDPNCVHQSKLGDSAAWLSVEPEPGLLRQHRVLQGPAGDVVLGWLAVVVYRSGETTARPSMLPVASVDDGVRVVPTVPEPGAGAGRRPAPAREPEPEPEPEPMRGLVIPPVAFSDWKQLDLMVASQDQADFAEKFKAAAASTPVAADKAASTPGDKIDPADVLYCIRFWLKHERGDALEQAFVEVANVESAQTMADAEVPDPSFAFAFGSCQYVTGLVDAGVGQASLERLARTIDTPDRRCDMALFLGDQIYADATAGLIDPTRRDELYEQPNDKAMRASGMRAVLRRVPARMLLDDHELKDNWEPLPPQVAQWRADAKRSNRLTLRRGVQAWLKFQRMDPYWKWRASTAAGDLHFMAGGLPFWFADTRTGRSARGSTMQPQKRKLLNDRQWQHLQCWLLAQGNRVKFIATPSLLLPRRRTTAAGEFDRHAGNTPGACSQAIVGEVGSAHSDAWDAFPVSMDALLAFIVEHRIRNTVFLSGDEHHSMIAEACIKSRTDAKAPQVKIVSVHSSGLYAPYPFANGVPDDLVQRETFTLPRVQVACGTHFAPPGDGFARLRVWQLSGVWMLEVDWIKSGGQSRSQTVSLS